MSVCVKIYNKNEAEWPILYHSDGAAGFDLPAAFASPYRDVEPGRSWVFKCGIYLEIPRGYVGLVFCRSGLPFRHQVISHTGVVDSDYRGEMAVCLFNLGHQAIRVTRGDRIAQMVVVPAPQVTFQPVASQAELSDTERGERGFGSTGGFVGSTGVR